MKTFVVVLIIGALVASAWMIVDAVRDNYQFSNQIGSYWSLSVKASSLDKKSQYLDEYIAALKAANLSGNDALFFPTPDNSYDQNFAAITSLQDRMHSFVGQDETSMAYQQAISQITAQEEDDNGDVVGTLEHLWWKSNHYFFWNPIYVLLEFIIPILMIVIGGVIIGMDMD